MNDSDRFVTTIFQWCDDGANIEFRFLPSRRQIFCGLGQLEIPDLPKGENVFVGVASRNGGGTKEHVVEIPALWVDIDFKKFPEAEATAALEAFPLTPTVIVASGGGLHAYWLFKEPMQKADIATVEGLNRRIAAYLRGDPNACDAARIMRLPGTRNYKYDPARPVTIVFLDNGNQYLASDFENFLPDEPERKTSTGPVGDPDEAIEAMMERCRFLQHCRDGAATLPEPEWYQLISVLARMPKGPEYIHQLSKPHPAYSPQETNTKIIHAINASGPVTCDHIRQTWDCGQDCGVKSPAAIPYRKPWQEAPRAEAGEVLLADYGHADILSRAFDKRFRWAVHRGSWMEYTGAVWLPVSEGRVAKRASDALRAEYNGRLGLNLTPDERKRLLKAMGDACVYSKVSYALAFLKGWENILTEAKEWDAKPWALNVENGTLDLRTGKLLEHRPDDLLTQLCPVPFVPNAQGSFWQKHLAIFQPDENIQRQIQRDAGVALVGATLEESFSMWHGSGQNGKSTTARAIMNVMGNYAIRAAPTLLIQKRHETHPTELADLAGKRMAFSIEVDDGNRLAEAVVKDLTGGDRKKARFMGRDFFEFEQTCSLVLAVNHQPVVRGTDLGMWRRIRLIPWDVAIPDDQKRPQDEVVAKLKAEGPAILNWMLEGLADWQKDRGWTAPEVRAATEDYRASQDVIGPFLADRCELGHDFKAKVKDLRTAYEEWCSEAGNTPLKGQTFNRRLQDRGLYQGRTNKARIWHGIRLQTTLC